MEIDLLEYIKSPSTQTRRLTTERQSWREASAKALSVCYEYFTCVERDGDYSGTQVQGPHYRSDRRSYRSLAAFQPVA